MQHDGGTSGRGGEGAGGYGTGRHDRGAGRPPDPEWAAPARAEGRVALVTGGNRGLGLRIVGELAARGMRVVLASRSAAAGQAAVDLLGDLADRVAVRQLDITDPASVARLVFAVRVQLGRCDVLVNNAAVLLEEDADSASSVDLDLARRTLETNLLGTWRMTQAVVPMMRARRYGRIINVAGDLGTPGAAGPDLPAYRISKDAVNALTRMFAGELAGDGILVNSYCPDVVPQENDPWLFSAPSETPVWLATLPDDGPTGGLYRERFGTDIRHRPR